MDKVFLIGIAGPSCSGKTTLAREVAPLLPGCGLLHADNYYWDLTHLEERERFLRDFDDPDAQDHALLATHLKMLADGRPVTAPVYDFVSHSRRWEPRPLEPARYWIIEGLHLLGWPAVRECLDVRLFVLTDHQTCLDRRMERDIRERGHTPEGVRTQYDAFVRPWCDKFVIPSSVHADAVLDGRAHVRQSVQIVKSLIL